MINYKRRENWKKMILSDWNKFYILVHDYRHIYVTQCLTQTWNEFGDQHLKIRSVHIQMRTNFLRAFSREIIFWLAKFYPEFSTFWWENPIVIMLQIFSLVNILLKSNINTLNMGRSAKMAKTLVSIKTYWQSKNWIRHAKYSQNTDIRQI